MFTPSLQLGSTVPMLYVVEGYQLISAHMLYSYTQIALCTCVWSIQPWVSSLLCAKVVYIVPS